MLVLAPAACIVGGIALSTAFDTLTRSVKYAPAALPALLIPSEKVRVLACICYIDSFELVVPGSTFSKKVGIILRVRGISIVRDVHSYKCVNRSGLMLYWDWAILLRFLACTGRDVKYHIWTRTTAEREGQGIHH